MDMSTVNALIILGETLVVMFIIWGFMHEDRFIRFENRIAEKFRSRRSKRASRAKRLHLVVDRTKKDDPDYSAA